jgi:Tol biopolymer transport system component
VNRQVFRSAVAIVTAAGVALLAGACGGASKGPAIVFSATPPGASTEQLFGIQPSGAGLKQLTTGAHPATAPAFSPDGKRLAFSRGGDGIFTIRVDGTDARRLTTGARDSYPTWSPDGREVAFVRPVGTQWRLYVVPSNGAAAKQLSQAPPAGRPSWTKTGLLVPSGGDLLKVDPRNGRVLKYYDANIDAIWGLNTVALSPSVSTLTYVGARAPEPGDMECGEGPCQRFGLFVESLTSKRKAPRMIDRDAGPAAFSPDGTQVVFAADGKLKLRSLGSGRTKAVATGHAYPTNSAPPAWR